MTYWVTDSHGEVFTHTQAIGREGVLTFAIVATYPYIREHIYA